MAKYYIGGENQTTIEKLLAGETVIVKGKGYAFFYLMGAIAPNPQFTFENFN